MICPLWRGWALSISLRAQIEQKGSRRKNLVLPFWWLELSHGSSPVFGAPRAQTFRLGLNYNTPFLSLQLQESWQWDFSASISAYILSVLFLSVTLMNTSVIRSCSILKVCALCLFFPKVSPHFLSSWFYSLYNFQWKHHHLWKAFFETSMPLKLPYVLPRNLCLPRHCTSHNTFFHWVSLTLSLGSECFEGRYQLFRLIFLWA